MGNIAAFFMEQNPNRLEHIIREIDSSNPRRPAWIQVEVKNQIPWYLAYDGEDGTRTHYIFKFHGYYLPIDAFPDEIRTFYDYIAPIYDAINSGDTIIAKFIRSKVRVYCNHNPVHALDIYAGTGIVASEIADLCETIDLMDLSEEMIKQAKKKGNLTDARFIVGDITDIQLDREYDLVVSSMGFHYLNASQTRIALKKLYDSIPLGGILVNVCRISMDLFREYFSIVESGIFDCQIEGKPALRYCIGRKD